MKSGRTTPKLAPLRFQSGNTAMSETNPLVRVPSEISY